MTLLLLLNPRSGSAASSILKFSTVVSEGLDALVAENLYKTRSADNFETIRSESVITIRSRNNFDTTGGD